MKNLINDILFFRNLVGSNFYLVIILGLIALFSESIGIISIFPLVSAIISGEHSFSVGNTTIHDSGMVFGFVAAFFFSAKAVLQWLALRLMGRSRAHVIFRCKERVFSTILNSNFSGLDLVKSNVLSNIFTDELTRVHQTYFFLIQLVISLLSLVLYVFVAAFFSLYVLFGGLFFGALLALVYRSINSKTKNISVEITAHNEVLVKNISNVFDWARYIKSTNRGSFFSKDFSRSLLELVKRYQAAWDLTAVAQSLREPLILFGLSGFLFVYFYLESGDIASAAVLFAAVYKALGYALSAQGNYQKYLEFRGGLHAYEKFMTLMAPAYVEQKCRDQPMSLDGATLESIRVEGISFGYDRDAPLVFDKFSHKFVGATFTAIVGRSGAGKSTFLDLMLGLREASAGSIRIHWQGDTPFAVKVNEIQDLVGFVPQKPVLLRGTVIENLELGGDEADRVFVLGLLNDLNLTEWFEKLPFGFETVVGPSAVELSGGESQRLALAREILSGRPILVVDEVTSALDGVSRSKVAGLLRKLAETGGVTVLAVTHDELVVNQAHSVLRLGGD